MANKPTHPSSALSVEQQAARLKAKDQPLGERSDAAERSESSPIGWETGIDAQPGTPNPAPDTAGRATKVGAGGTALETGVAGSAPHPLAHGNGVAPDAGIAPAFAGSSVPAGNTSPKPGSSQANLPAGRQGTAGRTPEIVAHTEIGSAHAQAPGIVSAGSASSGHLSSATKTDGHSLPHIPLKVSGSVAGTVDEDGIQISSGQLDVSGGQGSRQWTLINADGRYGNLVLDQDGHWQYQLDNRSPAVQSLQAEQEATERFVAIVTDASGQAQVVQIVIAVHGTNDAAVVTGVDVGQVSEDQSLEAGGKLVVSDADSGEAHFQPEDLAGQFGTLHLDADGQWRYALDNASVQKLGAGETAHDVLTVTTADGTSHRISISINGTQDAPLISGTATGVIDEDQQGAITGKLGIVDVDQGQAAFVPVANGAGLHGSFSLAADGTWSYLLDTTDPVVQGLAANQKLTDTVQITSVDGTAQTLTVTIVGRNDAALIGGVSTALVTEDSLLHTSGTLTISDADRGEAHFQAGTFTGQFGTLQLTADGHWTYALDNAQANVQKVGAGETAMDRFTVTSADGTTHQIALSIAGTNDAPQIAGTHTGALTEAQTNLVVGGTLDASDVDASAQIGWAIDHLDGLYGDLTFDTTSGAWHYTMDPARAQTLAQGQTAIENFTATVTDEHGARARATIAVTLSGSNTAPVLQGATTQPVREDDTVFTGQLLVQDPDQGDTHAFSVSAAVAGFTLGADGSYRFDPSDASYQHLVAGQTQTLTIPITVTDSAGATSTQNLTITITGTNDTPTIGGVSTGAVIEDSTLVATGQLTISDIDDGEAHFSAQTNSAGNYGTFSIDAAGRWTYTADNTQTVIQQLTIGDTLTDTLTVTSADGTSHTVTVTINGSNDAPVLVAQTQAVTEGGAQLAGRMVATDVDQGDTHSFILAQAVDGFMLNADGSYTFDPANSAYQYLAAGQTQDVVIPITVTDGAGATATQNLTITVLGANDAPTITGVRTGDVIEDTNLLGGAGPDADKMVARGKLDIADVDKGEAHFVAQDRAGSAGLGRFHMEADGQWSYVADPGQAAIQSLRSGQTLQESVTFNTADGTPVTLTVTIHGMDDRAVIAGVVAGSITEDANLQAGHLQANGTLIVTDPDAGQDHFMAQNNLAGSYGTFSIDASGRWRYSADNSQNALQQLKAGDTLTDTLTVTSADGTNHSVTVTIHGSNDALVLAAQQQAVTEDGGKLTGHMVATDVDQGDNQAFSTAAHIAGFTLNADGSYSFDPSDVAYQHLAAGQTQTLTIPITVADSAGATSTQNLSITLTGSNDGATITGANTGSTIEDNTQAVTGQLAISDVDDSQLHFAAQSGVAGSYGSFTLNDQGQWSYALDNGKPEVQALKNGDSVTDSFTVTSADGTTHQVSVTVTGKDDGALIAGVEAGRATEDQSVQGDQLEASGKLTVTDPDSGQNQFIGRTNAASTYGSFSIDASGHWTYSADNTQTAIQQLKSGDKVTDSMTVSSADGTQHTITITINGTNDAPVLQAQSQSVTEDGAVLTGQMVATDVDQGDTQVFTTQNPPPGFTLNPDGSYSFDAANPAYQHLAAGQSLVIDIPVTVTDRDGATDTQTLQITVTGANDAPRVFGPVNLGQMQEDGSLVLTAPQLLAQSGDIDTGDTLTLSQLAADHGQIVDNKDGTYTFTPDAHYNGPVAVSYQITDSQGASVSGSAGLNVSPVGDIAVIGGVDTGTVTEDVSVDQARCLTAGGQLTVIDPDAGEEHFIAQTNAAGSNGFGTFSLDALGHWTYSADNRQTAVQQLKTGEQLTDSLTVTSADGTSHTVTVTTKGTNDAPVLQAQSQSVAEDGALLNGKMHATDADAGETQTFSTQSPPAGFTLNADGSYSFDPADVAYQHLGLGQPQVISIPVTVTDSTGLTSTRNLVITLTGTNDAPQLLPIPVKVLEGSAPIQGQLTAIDPDTGDTLTYSTKGRVPGFVINPDGSFHFDPAHTAYNALSAGEERVVSIPVTVTDGHGGSTTESLEITVTGTDDGPALTATAQTVSEGAAVLTGQLVGTDPDSGDTLNYSTTATSDGFTLNADGSYSFDPAHAAYNDIGVGQTRILTIPVTVSDGHGGTATQSLQITVTGTNDAPVMVAEPARTTAENSGVLRGQLAATDPDHADTLTYRLSTPVPGFLINPDGSYTFNPGDGAYNHLAAGQSQVVSIPVVVTDGHGGTDTQVLQITVTGTDDGPAFVIVGTRSATEGGAILTGQLTATDPDTGDTLTYGTNAQVAGFVLNADGSYSFDPSHADYDSLGVGHHKTASVPITVTDSQGQSVTQTLRITIAGTNDNPTVTALAPSTVAEDSAVLKGRLPIADVDAGDLLTCRTSATVAGFNLNPDGSYTFDPSNHAYDHLAPGDSEVLSIPVTVSDGHGGSASQTLQITVSGTNDGPALTVVDQTIGEGSAVLRGQLAATDPDRGDTLTYSTGATVPGFTLNADGSYSFDADHAAYNSLGVGHSQVISIPITVTDSHGGTDTRNLQITVEGTDDAPILTATPRSVSEGDALIRGRLTAVDPDVGDALTYSTTATVAGFRLTPDGSYSFDPGQSAYNSLAAGTTLDVTIPVTVSDGHGGTTTQNLVITVAGANDAARISGTSTGTVTEDTAVITGKVSASGTLTVIDVDNGEAHFVAQSGIAGTYGTLSIDEQGHWTYTADNNQVVIQQLKAGDSLTESLKLTSADGTSHTVTVTIRGTNDVPLLQAQTQAVTEDGAILQGHLSASDIDTGDTLAFSTTATVDGFSLNADGSYQFDPSHASYQHLAAGQTETLTIPITVTDSDGASSTQHLTITISGLNDGARISGTRTGTVTEDNAVTAGAITTTGTLTVNDVDDGEARFVAQSGIAGTYGSLTIDEQGHWTYSAANTQKAIQNLNTGDHLTDTLTVRAADGTTQTISITLEGKDDQVLAGSLTGSAVEDTTPIITGDLRHVQSGTALHLGDQILHGQFGTLDLRDGGHWVYTLDNANPLVQGSKVGETRTDTITVHSPQGEPQDITITITGTHDQPVIRVPMAATHGIEAVEVVSAINGATHFGSIAETATGVATGLKVVAMYLPGSNVNQLAGIPEDQLASTQSAYTMNGGLGYQYLSSSGWLASHMPSLAATFNTHGARNNWDGGIVVFQDGSIGRMINVHGGDTGEKDYIYFNLIPGVNANHGLTILHGTGTVGATLEVFDGQVSLGHVTVAADGRWTLTATQALVDGDHQLHTLTNGVASDPQTVLVSGGTVTITDQAASLGAVAEDSATQSDISGHLTVSDADINDHPVFTAQHDVQGSYGKFSIDAQGQWHYTLDNNLPATQALADGQVTTETFHVMVTTDSGETVTRDVTFRVIGTNDAPVLSAQVPQAVDAGGTPIRGQIVATDVDQGDSFSFSTTHTVDGFAIHADGSYTFDPSNAAYQHLAGGQKQDVIIPITVTDSAGSTSTQNVTITVTGVSHVAVITGVDTGTVTENAAQDVVGGQLHVTDPDASQEHFVSQMQTHGQHGRFSIDPSGAWSYVLDNADPAVQALKAGTTLTDSLTVASVDGTTHVLMVTVKGSNDGPTLQAQSQSVSEDGSRLNGQMVAHDPDAGDSLGFSTGSQISGFTLHGDGSYTFDPGHADYQGLTSGQVKDVVIPITVTDGSGATSQQNLTIHVTGHDDRAAISGVDTGQVELGPTPEATGQLQVSDSDAGQSGFQTGQIKGSFGSLTMDAQGHWTYQIDANDWVVQGLRPGSHMTDQVTVHSVDGTAHDIEIEVRGTPAGYQPSVAQIPASTSGGHEIYDAVLASVRAGGYQYQGLADELDRGSLAAVGNMDLSVTGVHVQVVDRFGHTVQSIAPGAENAATLHVSDLLLWHAEGHSIVASSDSGLGSARMWLHDAGDMHNITVHLPNGTGFNGWTGEYTFGELPLQGPSAAPPPAPAPEQQDFMPDDILNIHAEPMQIHGLDALHDYLQFADTSPKVGAGGTAHEAPAAPLDDYLAAAGVDPAHVSVAPPDLPPTEILVETHSALDCPVTPDDHAADDAALDAIPHDLVDTHLQDDPQHHGV